MKTNLATIASMTQGELIGNAQLEINGISTLDHITSGSLVLADGKESLQRAEQSDAAVILVAEDVTSSVKPLIRVAHPFKAFVQLLNHFHPNPPPAPGVHPSAVIAKDVVLGKGVCIGPLVVIEEGSQLGDNCVIKGHVFIGKNVSIGAHTTLHPHVTIYDNCQLGKHVTIHASTVIGSDGFGYKFIEGRHLKVPHCGHVLIHDHVEIGANTVIDRAPLQATVIGEGTKIDNLVQVAHSVQLGKHNILCAFTGIAGSTVTGDRVVCAANVGVSDHVQIDDDVILGARTGVPPQKHLLRGLVYLGNPARPKEKALEQEFSSTRIPFMRKNIKTLTEKIKELTERVTIVEHKNND